MRYVQLQVYLSDCRGGEIAQHIELTRSGARVLHCRTARAVLALAAPVGSAGGGRTWALAPAGVRPLRARGNPAHLQKSNSLVQKTLAAITATLSAAITTELDSFLPVAVEVAAIAATDTTAEYNSSLAVAVEVTVKVTSIAAAKTVSAPSADA